MNVPFFTVIMQMMPMLNKRGLFFILFSPVEGQKWAGLAAGLWAGLGARPGAGGGVVTGAEADGGRGLAAAGRRGAEL